VNGDGNGPVANSLYPRPRDYTKGVFKFTSTPYGMKPRREDLMAILDRGIVGTSMPNFRLLPKKEVEAVVDYVLVLAQRGELEFQLANEAEASEELDPEYVPEFVTDVGTRWKEASHSLTQPLTPEPELTMERVTLGREAFLSKGCSKCHGDDGRGHTKDNIGKDYWGHSTRAADLTSGMLHGGQEPIDIYRRIMNGINGTPMPGFKSALESEPETIWNLVSYVLYVSDRRREGTLIPAGLMKPYADPVPAEGTADAAEE
jgi:mono/diheme cytochrome c family protein